jgi:hypothetical protein
MPNFRQYAADAAEGKRWTGSLQLGLLPCYGLMRMTEHVSLSVLSLFLVPNYLMDSDVSKCSRQCFVGLGGSVVGLVGRFVGGFDCCLGDWLIGWLVRWLMIFLSLFY